MAELKDKENSSLDSLISLVSRHYEPLISFKQQVVPLIESVTLMRSVGWNNPAFHLAPYYDRITALYKETPDVIESISSGGKTTELILKRIISSVVKDREDYSSKDYNSLRLLASCLNPSIPFNDELLDKVSDKLKQNNDFANIDEYAKKISETYFGSEQVIDAFKKQIVKAYFQFHMPDAKERYMPEGQYSILYHFFGDTGIETCHLDGKVPILEAKVTKFRDNLDEIEKSYHGANVAFFAFGDFGKEAILLKKYGEYLNAKNVYLFPVR